MSETTKGLLAILGACIIWGLGPIFYKLLIHVPPLELLAHRVVWSCVFFGLLLIALNMVKDIGKALKSSRNLLRMFICACIISINWFGLIYAVQIEQTIQVSLAFFIYPLLSVLLGILALGERLKGMQTFAILLVASAVALLLIRLDLPPYLALVMAGCFSIYGLIKKNLDVAPMTSVFVEVVLVAPIALWWLWQIHMNGAVGMVDRPAAWFGASTFDTAMLILSGPLTGCPLLLFTYAARRLRMSTIGLLQYLNPTLQFCVAVILFQEPFTRDHMIAFPMIWVAILLYSLPSLKRDARF